MYSKLLIETLAKLLSIQNQYKAILTTDTFSKGWMKMKEKTSAGISGIHFGYMKAYTGRVSLANFKATIRHIPYNIGYSLTN